MSKITFKLESWKIWLIVGVIGIVFFGYLFGMVGLRLFLGAVLIYFLPVYLVLGRLDIEEGERLIFAFFIGLGVFSVLTYYIGQFVVSLRYSALITLVIMYATAFVLRYKDLGKLKKGFKKISEHVELEE